MQVVRRSSSSCSSRRSLCKGGGRVDEWMGPLRSPSGRGDGAGRDCVDAYRTTLVVALLRYRYISPYMVLSPDLPMEHHLESMPQAPPLLWTSLASRFVA